MAAGILSARWTPVRLARSTAIVSAAAGGLALVGSPAGILPLLALGLGLVVGPPLAARGRGGSARLWTVGTVIVLVLAPLDYVVLTRSIVLTGGHVLIYLQINRLFQLRGASEARQVTLLALLTLMLAAVLTLSLWFVVALAVFSISATWAMAMCALVSSGSADVPARVPRSTTGLLTAAGVGIVVLTGAFFLVLPRIRIRTIQGTQAAGVSVVGFADRVSLGDFGAVKADNTPVLRATIVDSAVDTPYWRGSALDRYEDGTWQVSDLSEDDLSFARSATAWNERVFTVASRRGHPVEQEIILEPLDENVLFALPGLISLQGDLPPLTKGSTGSVFFHGSGGRKRYHARSVPVVRPRPGDDVSLPDEPMPERYLQVPEELREPLHEIATAATVGATSNRQRAAYLERYFADFTYSLSPPKPQGDPVLDFLTRTHAGYCEHYASAMVLLARTLGLPARMATGFSGGEYNELGDYHLVRQRDAHTWVEIHYQTSGWVLYDPTPPSAEPSGLLAGASRGLDYLRMLWIQRVFEYNLLDQFRLLRAAGQRASRLQGILSSGLGGVLGNRVLVWGVLLLAAAGLIYFVYVRRTPGRLRAGRSRWEGPVADLWKQVVRRLERAGVRREPGETAVEYLQRATGRLGMDDSPFRELAALHDAARFGDRTVNSSQINEMRAKLKQVWPSL